MRTHVVRACLRDSTLKKGEAHMKVSKKHTEGQEENYRLYWKILECVCLYQCVIVIIIIKVLQPIQPYEYHASKDHTVARPDHAFCRLREQKQHPMRRCVSLQHISVQQGHLYTKYIGICCLMLVKNKVMTMHQDLKQEHRIENHNQRIKHI